MSAARRGGGPSAAGALDLDDIQGLVLRGFGNLPAARYLLYGIEEPAAARAWLESLLPGVTASRARPADSALNFAFTAPGLRRLGLPEDVLAAFSPEWAEGMVEAHRSRILGDVGTEAPERWAWGGPRTPPVHVLALLFAKDEEGLAADTRALDGGAHGLRELARLDTVDLGGREHFGFRDGISQPVIAGSGRVDVPMNTIQPGEFVLGYPNEHGQLTPRPLLDPAADPRGLLPPDPAGSGRHDLGRNGSYLVFRQLSQDVLAFWRFADSAGRGPEGPEDPAARPLLAARMIGRWPGGAPLVLAPHADDPGLATANDFTYDAPDRFGERCPIAAHVRRANPRDSLEPGPGTPSSIQVGKRHRLLRRGREYGSPVDPATLPGGAPASGGDGRRSGAGGAGEERGLHFICLCANLARQFEFVQHTWLMSPKFDGLYEEQDPMLGAHGEGGQSFTVPARPVRRRYGGLPRFVGVRGGAYFFLPGLRALRYLAARPAR